MSVTDVVEELDDTSSDERPSDDGFLRYLSRLWVGSLVPGSWLVMTGRRRLGVVVVGLLLVLSLLVAVLVLRRPWEQIVGLVLDPQVLAVVALALGLAAGGMLLNGLASYLGLREADRPRWQRLTGGTTAGALVAVTAIPLGVGSYYALVQRDLVETVFVEETAVALGGAAAPNSPVLPAAVSDPWADRPRLTVLLLGSDSGPGRVGARTDTVIVASIDTATGRTTLFSLPRNLQQVPFPEGTAAAAAYPWGFTGDGSVGSDLLNAVYDTVPAYHPELFEDAVDPGAEAVKLAAEGILGIPVDHYVMVNMQGFQRLVDALGGVEIDVRSTIPMENKVLAEGVCSEPTGYIYPGRQTLDGWEAMWYARARCGGEGVADDYDRMRRQRCVIGAMVDRSDPLNVLRQFDDLASATKSMVTSDIAQSELSAFVTLALRVKSGEITSLPFTNLVINPGYPDYAGIQAQVQQALAEPVEESNRKGDAGGSAEGSGEESSPGSTSPADQEDPGAQEPEVDESAGAVALDSVC